MTDLPEDNAALAQCWGRVTQRMRHDIGDAAWRNWIKPLRVNRLEAGTLTLETDSTLTRERVNSQYADRLRVISAAEFKTMASGVNHVEVRIAKALAQRTDRPHRMSEQKPVEKTPSKDKSYDLSAGLDPRYTFANFVVGKPNELAFAVARRTAESEKVAFNPLFLYGGVGLGKTHLMHAIAWEIRRNDPSRRVIYTSAEKFMYQFIRALRYKDMMSFKQQFREVDVLMVDDIQFIAGKDSTQEEFFHTFNTLIDHNHQVVISADRSPVDLDGIEERIRSRLGWGLVTDIHASDYELRLGVLQTKAKKHVEDNPEIIIKDNILEFLAQRIDSNIRVLEGALNRVIAYSSFVNKPLTIEMAQEVLKDLIRASQRRITIDDIQRKVADYYNIRLSDLLSARRSRTIARPRQVAMYLSKILTTRSLPEIGRKFGGRDHTTVIHAVKRIESLQDSDNAIQEEVEVLSRALEN